MKETFLALISAALLSMGAESSVLAAPAQVLIIRHAEKPETGPDLSEKGRQRAEALVEFFRKDPSVTRFGTPVALYAAAPPKVGGSQRSIQTLEPLARKLRLPVRSGYVKTQYSDLVSEIMGKEAHDGKTVLIAWAHEEIKSLARSFGARHTGKWPDPVFDRVWRLDFDSQGRVTGFTDLPQKLLPGDSQ
jgi:hypothetical protein